ncbi:unnamed protein product [Paramecium pentaurelia]|uniref:Importin subunit alpha n=1 Tax=Paramecium pentaurelia TaxID=43138 RepID=A0A8S1V9I7_9CILI|nr:unnamed protein product [Paramecium pentaurelia]
MQPQNQFSLFGNVQVNEAEQNSEVKKKREEFATEIRSRERNNIINNKRLAQNNQTTTIPESLPLIPSTLPQDLQLALKAQQEQLMKRSFTFEDFPDILQKIFSSDILQLHYGVTGLRKMLSVESGAPIQQVIDANLVPKLIDIIQKEQIPQLVLEAAWALTNVASGTTLQTQSIIDKGGIYLFVKLLSSQYRDIAEQAVWAIGNIAGDCTQYRDLILRVGGVDPLINIMQNAPNKNTIKHCTWSLSNLCRGKPIPDFKYVKNALPVFCKVIIDETDPEVLTDACWALSYLSDGDNSRLQTVIDSQVVPTLIKLLDHSSLQLVIPTLRILGNVVTGDETQTTYVLNQGLLLKIPKLLSHDKKAIRREACWTISNITAGSINQVSQVVRDSAILEKLFTLMTTDVEEIVREATWAISNSTKHGTNSDIQLLVQKGLLNVFKQLLEGEDTQTMTVVLEALLNVLKRGDQDFKDDNYYLTQLEQMGVISKIEQLQKHQNQSVYQKCFNILEQYYEAESEL